MTPTPSLEARVVIPDRLGKYRLVGQLGRGGMADVYLAVASGPGGFNKLHVLKLLRHEAFDTRDAAHMFATESRLAALLNHPNVVQTYEVGEEQGTAFMVMEYLEGQSLHNVLLRTQRSNGAINLSLAMRLRIVFEVLCGLHYAHELRDLSGQQLNLVHRDVSPHNIFVTYDGSIKLLDFGVAKTTSTASSTKVGTIKGKVAYMAPEQVNNASLVNRRTDVFQIGLVLWEGVVGRRVWDGLSDYEVLLKLANSDLPELLPPPDADPELVRICRRAIATTQEARYPTAEEFAADLEAFMIARDIRTTSKDVGGFVAKLFAEHRRELRDAVQARLQQMQDSTSPDDLRADTTLQPLFSGLLGPQTGSIRRDASASLIRPMNASDRSGRAVLPVNGLAQPIRSRTQRWPLALALTVGAVTVAGLAYFAAQRSQTATAASPVASAEPPSNQAEFSVAATPANARLFLDNAPLPSNPFRSKVAMDSALHMVRAEAPGYETASLVVRFDRNTENIIALTPQRASPPVAPPAAAPEPNREPRSVAVGRVAPHPRHKGQELAPAPTAQQAPAPPTPPPAPPQPTPTPAVKLDNSDPWR